MISIDELKNCPNYFKVGSNEEKCKATDEITTEERTHYKKVIEPWLSATLQSEHVSLLLGSGFTISVCSQAKVSSSSMSTASFGKHTDKINAYAEKSAQSKGRGTYNIEDQIRTALSLYEGLLIAGKEDAEIELGKQIDIVLSEFCNSILQSEKNLKEKLYSDNKAMSFS